MPATFSDGSLVNPNYPFRLVYRVRFEDIFTTAFEERWQQQLAAIRAETAAKQELRRQKNLKRYGIVSKAA